MQQPRVVEDDDVAGRQLHLDAHIRVVRQLGEAAARLVEEVQVTRRDRRGRVTARLGGEADREHAVRPAAARGVADARPELRLDLNMGHDVPERRAAITAIVLEAHGRLRERVEELGALRGHALEHCEAVDEAVRHRAVGARRGLALAAPALLDGVQELEVRRRVPVGVVGVHADGERRIGQVLLHARLDGRRRRLLLLLQRGGVASVAAIEAIRLRTHVELRAPLRGAQSGERRRKLRALALEPRCVAHEHDADGQEVAQRLAAERPHRRHARLWVDEIRMLHLGRRREVRPPEPQRRRQRLVDLEQRLRGRAGVRRRDLLHAGHDVAAALRAVAHGELVQPVLGLMPVVEDDAQNARLARQQRHVRRRVGVAAALDVRARDPGRRKLVRAAQGLPRVRVHRHPGLRAPLAQPLGTQELGQLGRLHLDARPARRDQHAVDLLEAWDADASGGCRRHRARQHEGPPHAHADLLRS
mmetsp:Transcript_93268/g.241071  ORF Transcript_93268/g.241071 Transcript_93268/m.241071 type:complete len:475 (+) Transcript_93268:737-2161(+)